MLNRKHLGWRAVYDVFGIAVRLLAHGQTNFVRMLWKFGDVYNVDRLVGDHAAARSLPVATAPGDGDRTAVAGHVVRASSDGDCRRGLTRSPAVVRVAAPALPGRSSRG